MRFPHSRRASFTLIELLIVVAIVAILAVVVVLTLNPAELLKQSRDANRLSDMDTLSKALALYQTDVVSGGLGTTNVMYVSVPDTSSTCANLGLPILPSGWTYSCAPTSTLRNVDGTGWLPVNFTQVSAGSPLAGLPVDPTNSTSTGLYYTYATGTGIYEATALLESQKYLSAAINDGDSYPGIYSAGNTHNITPGIRDYGLIGYWTFDEGSGSTALNSGTQRKNASLFNSPSWQSGTSCKVRGCLSLNGLNQYGSVSGATIFSDLTVCAWVLSNNPDGVGNPDSISNIVGGNGVLTYPSVKSSKLQLYDGVNWRVATTFWTASTWYHACASFVGSTKDLKLYTNGNLEYSASGLSTYANGILSYIGQYGNSTRYLNGSIDDLRLYNRALSAAEVAAIYNATR